MPLFFQLVGSFIWSVLTSRAGQIAVAFGVAWIWSGLKTDGYWKDKIATQEAARELAYQKEIARQEQAAREIATAATIRAEEDSRAQEEMRQQIEEFNKKEPVYVERKVPVPQPVNCHIDGGFSDVVRKLDAQAGKGKTPRGARKFR